MSRRSGTNPKLNLSPTPRTANVPSPMRLGSPATDSPPSLCVSSDADGHHSSSSSPIQQTRVPVSGTRVSDLEYIIGPESALSTVPDPT
ncbi:hypothetical protein SAY87_000958 [Trapa incisa]|uniref:Uncharacterized protein n=1 Tax=Trapa incisa TaxID=236973 RepID=A0AAN7JH03_9MYRT|nr:hypothetical protein SAY87_000958 [Trapa incisa]